MKKILTILMLVLTMSVLVSCTSKKAKKALYPDDTLHL